MYKYRGLWGFDFCLLGIAIMLRILARMEYLYVISRITCRYYELNIVYVHVVVATTCMCCHHETSLGLNRLWPKLLHLGPPVANQALTTPTAATALRHLDMFFEATA